MIPRYYSRLIPSEILDLPLSETTASCGNCVMAVSSKDPRRAESQAHFRRVRGQYKNHLKCCTYHPFLPNYAVGAILSDTSENSRYGRSSLVQKMADRTQLLPLGVPAPRAYQIEFHQSKSDFGKKDELLCPYFDSSKNQCGLWIYRGSVCTSFFCASDSSWGLEFWDELGLYLSLIEISLAELVLERMGFSSREMMLGFDLINLGKMKPSERVQKSQGFMRELKKSQFWVNRSPEAFYQTCYQELLKISQSDLEEAMGLVLMNQKKRVLSKFKGYRTKNTGDASCRKNSKPAQKP